jgi:hypothetical protein
MISSRKVDLAHATHYYPFEGDETDVTLLSDRIVRAAKSHPICQICDGAIAAGEHHRVRTERDNEAHKVMSFRFCNRCCRAMAHPDTYDTGRLIDSRWTIGERRRRVRFGLVAP